MQQKNKAPVALFLIGILVCFLGYSFVWIPQTTINGLNVQLNHAAPSQRQSIENLILSYNIDVITIYQPMSIFLFITGGTFLTLAIVLAIYRLTKKETTEKDNIQESTAPSDFPQIDTSVKVGAALRNYNRQQYLDMEKSRLSSIKIEPDFEETYHKETYRTNDKPTRLWFLVPLLFGFIGGLIGYVGTKNEDSELAGSLLLFGIVWSVILLFIGWAMMPSLF
jgi:hypothetical protein